jgi:arylsulfatase A-like enzyme
MKRTTKTILAIISLLFTNIGVGLTQSNLPNFIIILADDLGYGDLGCYGHPTILTPNLDKMAAEGMRFTQFYVGAAVCSPSRAALLTGRMGVRTGVYGNKDKKGNSGVVFLQNSTSGLPLNEITIAEMLKSKGYQTGIIGKWHLGHMPEFLPVYQGFDYWYGIDHHQNGISETSAPRANPDIKNKTTSGPNKRPWCSLYRNDKVIEENPNMLFFTKQYTVEAINFIKNNKDKPFFLYYANNNPHTPLFASSDFAGKSKRGLYGDVVTELDWSVGQILNTLKDLNIDKNTLVLFTSDNGPWLTQLQRGGSAGILFEGKNSTYEGGMREPAIFWWPGTIKANQTNTALAATMDLFPTILNLAGIELPKDRVYDGTDMMPLLTGQKQEVRDIIYYYINDNLYAVRKGSWKAHFTTHASYSAEAPVTHETPLLYNIDADPSEKYNLAKQHPDIIEDLRKVYEKQKTIIAAPPEINKELPA